MKSRAIEKRTKPSFYYWAVFALDTWSINYKSKIINLVKKADNMKNEILIYNLPDGGSNVEVYLNEDDIWMNKQVNHET